MAGRVDHVERDAFDGELVALRQPHRHHVDLAALAHDGHAMGAVAQRAQPGDVIGMQVGIDGLDQLEVELAYELNVAVDLLQYRIDDQRFAAVPAGEKVGVGARSAVEQLTKDHGRVPPDGFLFSVRRHPGYRQERRANHAASMIA